MSGTVPENLQLIRIIGDEIDPPRVATDRRTKLGQYTLDEVSPSWHSLIELQPVEPLLCNPFQMICGHPDPVIFGCLLSPDELFTFVNPVQRIFFAGKGWEFQLMDMRSRPDAFAGVMPVYIPTCTIFVTALAAIAIAAAWPSRTA